LERQKKQYEEKIKEYTKNPEKLDRDINFAFAMGEVKRASLDA
jgi:Fe-S cluster assembly ATPase SufC